MTYAFSIQSSACCGHVNGLANVGFHRLLYTGTNKNEAHLRGHDLLSLLVERRSGRRIERVIRRSYGTARAIALALADPARPTQV